MPSRKGAEANDRYLNRIGMGIIKLLSYWLHEFERHILIYSVSPYWVVSNTKTVSWSTPTTRHWSDSVRQMEIRSCFGFGLAEVKILGLKSGRMFCNYFYEQIQTLLRLWCKSHIQGIGDIICGTVLREVTGILDPQRARVLESGSVRIRAWHRGPIPPLECANSRHDL